MTGSEKEDLEVLAKKFGLEQMELLREALTHPVNKRMAWLGDAVLYLAVTEHLHRQPDTPTSILDPKRQGIIRNLNLKETVAGKLHLTDYIKVPPSERDPHAKGVLATAYEALIGAIFLEKGYETAADQVRMTIFSTAIETD